MKRLRPIFAILAMMLILACGPAYAYDTDAKAYILYEPRTGTVLDEKHADDPMLIASTTKIMTALVVLEHCALQETVIVAAEASGIEGSSMYLREGDRFTVEELLYGLMLSSANDAAAALAIHTAGSVEAFAALMNAKAAELGLQHTHYQNPHGLDAPEHYSSARDLALLTTAAMDNREFCRLFSAGSYDLRGTVLLNHNKLLQGYAGCIGGKTGYTRASGRTLVSCAERDGLRLICVTLDDANDWADHRAMFDYGFSSYRFLTLPADAWRTVPVISSRTGSVELLCPIPYVLLRKAAPCQVKVELPRFVFAPVKAGDILGRVTVTENGVQLVSAELTAAFDAPEDPNLRLMPWERFRSASELFCVTDVTRGSFTA